MTPSAPALNWSRMRWAQCSGVPIALPRSIHVPQSARSARNSSNGCHRMGADAAQQFAVDPVAIHDGLAVPRDT